MAVADLGAKGDEELAGLSDAGVVRHGAEVIGHAGSLADQLGAEGATDVVYAEHRWA
jgi:hypothetical protein